MTATSSSEGADDRQGGLGTSDTEAESRRRRRPSVLSMLDSPRGSRRAAATRPAGWPRLSATERSRGAHGRAAGGALPEEPSELVVLPESAESGVSAESAVSAGPAVTAGPAVSPSAGAESGESAGTGVSVEPGISVDAGVSQDDGRSSRGETRHRQRRARLAVGLGLVAAAGLTVLALVTAGSSPGSVTQSPIIPTSGPSAVGTAGLVPVPQSPPTTP